MRVRFPQQAKAYIHRPCCRLSLVQNLYDYTATNSIEENKSKANQRSATGLPFFRNHVTEPIAVQNNAIAQSDDFNASATHACGTSAFANHHSNGDSAKAGLSKEVSVLNNAPNEDSPNEIARQTTADGRILPVAMYPAAHTPSELDEKRIPQFNENTDTPFVTPTDATPASKFTKMAPPPPKRPSTVTPMSTSATASFVREGTPLLRPQQLAGSAGEETFAKLSTNFESNTQALGDNNYQKAIGENPVLVEGNDTLGSNDISFVDQHQHFTSTIQKLQDQDGQYQDMLLEGTMKLNIATSMLLQLKCDMYDLTDHILDELDSVQDYMQDFLPVVESD